VKKDASIVGQAESEKKSEFDEDPDIRAARDKYVQEQTREMLYSMKSTEFPKGVKFSYLMMSFPLICTTTYLGLLTPIVTQAASTVDPASFAYLARTCLRLLALNISFTVSTSTLTMRQGGIHYGFASATYETAVTDEELKRIKYQMIFSFLPAALSFSFTSTLLFAQPITMGAVIFSFTGLMVTQLLTLQMDLKCVERELAP